MSSLILTKAKVVKSYNPKVKVVKLQPENRHSLKLQSWPRIPCNMWRTHAYPYTIAWWTGKRELTGYLHGTRLSVSVLDIDMVYG